MIVTNKLNLPESIVKKVQREPHNKPGHLSCTTLLQGTCCTILTERYFDKITVDASDQLSALWGETAHAILEDAEDGNKHEISLEYDLGNGITITGRIDAYNEARGEIIDYKNVSVWKVRLSDFKDFARQLKLYGWLLRKNGRAANVGRIIMLIRDWSPREASRDPEYPQSPVVTYEVQFSEEEFPIIEKWVYTKVNTYLEQRELPDEQLTLCEPELRWQTPEKWAVMKMGRKSALKLYETEEEARERVDAEAEFGSKCYIEHRAGENRKCAGYCICKEFCKLGGNVNVN